MRWWRNLLASLHMPNSADVTLPLRRIDDPIKNFLFFFCFLSERLYLKKVGHVFCSKSTPRTLNERRPLAPLERTPVLQVKESHNVPAAMDVK